MKCLNHIKKYEADIVYLQNLKAMLLKHYNNWGTAKMQYRSITLLHVTKRDGRMKLYDIRKTMWLKNDTAKQSFK